MIAASVEASGALSWSRPLSWLCAVDTQVDSLAAAATAIVPFPLFATAVGAYFTRVGRYRSLIAPVVGLALTTAVTGLALVPALGALVRSLR